MNIYRQTAANLEEVLHSPQFRLEYTGKYRSSVFYCAILPDQREDLQLKCEIDASWNTISFVIILPVIYSENTSPNLSCYIDRVNRIYGSRGFFALFDEDTLSIRKEVSCSGFAISTDSILNTILSLKANVFDFIEVLRCIGKDNDVTDDNSIASAIYYEIYPEKKPVNSDDNPDDDFWERIEENLDFDIDDLIKKIDAKIAEIEAKNTAEEDLEDTIDFQISEDHE